MTTRTALSLTVLLPIIACGSGQTGKQASPYMSDSRKMADWRANQHKEYKVADAIVEPLEGLGVPAIRNEFGVVAIEMAVGTQLVTVSSISANFEQVRKLAGFVLARMK